VLLLPSWISVHSGLLATHTHHLDQPTGPALPCPRPALQAFLPTSCCSVAGP